MQETLKLRHSCILITSVFLISICGLVYELLISTLSSYILGSSVLHFSITIGLFMSFMGVGSYFSRFIHENLLDRFILIETLVGIIGGLSAFLLFSSYSLSEYYYLVAFLLIASISICIGLEVPIVTRILKGSHELKDILAHILAFDYIGSLIGALLFPLVLLPYLGLLKTSLLIGALNLVVALFNTFVFRDYIKNFYHHVIRIGVSLCVLLVGFIYAFSINSYLEEHTYQDPIVVSEQTEYQKIVVTQFKEDIRLYINGNLQFSTIDEYRYHEPLVHIPFSAVRLPTSVLILGGGDGLVAKEVLKHKSVKDITIVDLDSKMTEIAAKNRIFQKLNQNTLANPKVQVINQDAFNFIRESNDLYSLIIVDLPDPNSEELGKLYSKEFYRLVSKRLSADGVMVTQATSPFFARIPFWIIAHTIESVFAHHIPFTSYVPSFGQWGFVMASKLNLRPDANQLPPELRFVNSETFPSFFVFPPDISEVDTEVNVLNNQILVKSYEESWEHWE